MKIILSKYRKFVCLNHPDNFCFVCGCYIYKTQRSYGISEKIKTAYRLYFDFPLPNQEDNFCPHVICPGCYSSLTGWMNGKRKQMPFHSPVLWKVIPNHYNDCYFCLFKPPIGQIRKENINYPVVSHITYPVYYTVDSVHMPPISPFAFEDATTKEVIINDESEDYCLEDDSSGSRLVNQEMLNKFVVDLKLSKKQSEMAASTINNWNMLDSSANITYFRKRNFMIRDLFHTVDEITYCYDIEMLFEQFGLIHSPLDWRLFMDSNQISIKGVLLHNTNKLPSVPIFYSKDQKETYLIFKKIFELICYKKYGWKICGDFKVLNIVTGLQPGFTTHCCFLCLFNSRERNFHYAIDVWPVRSKYHKDEKTNVLHTSLINPKDAIIPDLHLKLGFFKQMVVQLGREPIEYLKKKFPKKSSSKVEAGIFIDPEIRSLSKDANFDKILDDEEYEAWNAFKAIVDGFLGKYRAENYVDLIENFFVAFENLGCLMSPKMHYLRCHLDVFPENCSDFSDQHGERFHQQLRLMESYYNADNNIGLLSDYCWAIKVQLQKEIIEDIK